MGAFNSRRAVMAYFCRIRTRRWRPMWYTLYTAYFSPCKGERIRRIIVPIQYVSGDLFENAHHAQAFAHGCNCQGSMGAGIATGFRDRYPEMYAQYRAMCKAEPRQFNLGDVFLWQEESKPAVFN